MGLKQLIKVPIRITSKTSTLIDHILKSSRDEVVQAGIIKTSLSDYQLIFCSRKIKREKPTKHNYLIFRSMKNVSAEIYEEAVSKITHSDVTSKIFVVVKKVAPTKTIRVKNKL